MDLFRLAATLVILFPITGAWGRIHLAPPDFWPLLELGMALGIAFVVKELFELSRETFRKLHQWWLCAFELKV